MEKNAALIKSMQDTYLELWHTLDSFITEGKITEFEKVAIKAMCDKVTVSLSDKYQKVKEGVEAVMGGQILEYEAKTILNKGIAQGKAEEALLSVCNMLELEVPEEKVKELYPEFFEQGKKMFLERSKNER